MRPEAQEKQNPNYSRGNFRAQHIQQRLDGPAAPETIHCSPARSSACTHCPDPGLTSAHLHHTFSSPLWQWLPGRACIALAAKAGFGTTASSDSIIDSLSPLHSFEGVETISLHTHTHTRTNQKQGRQTPLPTLLCKKTSRVSVNMHRQCSPLALRSPPSLPGV